MPENLPAYSVGCSVRLKTVTGPNMLVDDVLRVLNVYRYRCTWLDTFGAVQFADFAADELEKIPPNPSADTRPITAADFTRRQHKPL